MSHPDDKVTWPDGTECRFEELHEFTHMSDDYTITPFDDLSWLPEASARPDGYECLIFWRGKWRTMRWSSDHEGWSLGYGRGFVVDLDETIYAPLPENTPPAHLAEPQGPYGFYGWHKD